MNEIKTYECKDFYLAVLLETEGYLMIDSYKKPEGVYFVFQVLDEKKLAKLINDFINYNAYVNLRRYTSSVVKIRKEIQKHNK